MRLSWDIYWLFQRGDTIKSAGFGQVLELMEPAAGIEPATYCLQNSCSAAELRRRGGLQPPGRTAFDPSEPGGAKAGGQGRIRTFEAVKQEIYSLSPLTAWVPARIPEEPVTLSG